MPNQNLCIAKVEQLFDQLADYTNRQQASSETWVPLRDKKLQEKLVKLRSMIKHLYRVRLICDQDNQLFEKFVHYSHKTLMLICEREHKLRRFICEGNDSIDVSQYLKYNFMGYFQI